MKKLLVLAPHPELVESIRAGINPEHYRVLHRASVEEAEPILAQGLADACIIDVELTNVQGIWFIEKLRRRAPKVPVIIYTSAKEWQWEEEAYLHGATHVLNKPVRPRMLNALLERLWPAGQDRPRLTEARCPGGRRDASPTTLTTPARLSRPWQGSPGRRKLWVFCVISRPSSLIPLTPKRCSRSSCCGCAKS